MLNFIFGDTDHILHNYEKDEEGRFAYYDYDKTFNDQLLNDFLKDSKALDRLLQYLSQNFSNEEAKAFFSQIKIKLEAIEQRLSNNEFLKAILEQSNFNTDIFTGKINNDMSTDGRMKNLRNYFSPLTLALKNGVEKELHQLEIDSNKHA